MTGSLADLIEETPRSKRKGTRPDESDFLEGFGGIRGQSGANGREFEACEVDVVLEIGKVDLESLEDCFVALMGKGEGALGPVVLETGFGFGTDGT